jgi:DNA-binding IclR family transcriptional regulator
MTKTIKSDERLLKILRVLREKETAGVTELANAVELPKSTVHIHLATLEENNFVVKKDGQYQIGLQFLDFGKAVQKNNPLYGIVKENAEELAQETGEQAWCLVEEHNQAIYLYGSHGDRAIQTHTHVGKREELPNLAGGRAILANLPEEQREEVINAYQFDNNRDLPFSDRTELIERLEQVQADEIALNTESYVKGVNAVGAPIIDNTGKVYGALSIFGPANRLKEEYIRSEISDLLLGVTNEIGINLTYQ